MTRGTRPARAAVAGLVLAGALTLLSACGGRTDGGTPVPDGGGDATSTTVTTVPGG